jgi:hypothetical protein
MLAIPGREGAPSWRPPFFGLPHGLDHSGDRTGNIPATRALIVQASVRA